MAAISINWTNPAVDDLLSIREFLADFSTEIADRIIDRIIQRVEILNKGFLEIGALEPLLV